MQSTNTEQEDNSSPAERSEIAPRFEDGEIEGPPSPYRPSRRAEIIFAAIHVFAIKGFHDSTIQDIADEAGVVPTAIYYHFEGKSDLFDACIARVWQSLDKATAQARPESGTVDSGTYIQVIEAAWSWVERYPDAATLLYLQTPGATARSRQLHETQLARHMHRAFDYLDAASPPQSRRQASIIRATQSLSLRTLLALVIGIHPLRMHDGPLNDIPTADLRQSLQSAALRLLKQS